MEVVVDTHEVVHLVLTEDNEAIEDVTGSPCALQTLHHVLFVLLHHEQDVEHLHLAAERPSSRHMISDAEIRWAIMYKVLMAFTRSKNMYCIYGSPNGITLEIILLPKVILFPTHVKGTT